jgi:DNA-binding MarR family transcriptional regulator/catechol 2,3-dioxygenase-like lactoylglutathione lyase family enzyme
MSDIPWYETIAIPALMRHARATYGMAMRKALGEAGYDDLPQNGLYVIGGLAREGADVPLAQIIDDLRLSKQAAGQLVDTLVTRGYLERNTDPEDRRRLIVSLTERGRDAASVQTHAREGIDDALAERVGTKGLSALRKMLAALIGIGQATSTERDEQAPTSRVRGIIPILFVTDVSRTARFFSDQLGFTTEFLHGTPPFYGSVSRDGACLHLRYVAAPNFTELAAKEDSLIVVSVEVSDVHALHAEFEKRGVTIARDLVDQPWGGTDFHLRDPDGNEISFVTYRRIQAAIP